MKHSNPRNWNFGSLEDDANVTFSGSPSGNSVGPTDEDLDKAIRKGKEDTERRKQNKGKHFSDEEYKRLMKIWGPVAATHNHDEHGIHGLHATKEKVSPFRVCRDHVTIANDAPDEVMRALMLHAHSEFGGKLYRTGKEKHDKKQLENVWMHCQATGVEFDWKPLFVTKEMKARIEQLKMFHAAHPTEEAKQEAKASTPAAKPLPAPQTTAASQSEAAPTQAQTAPSQTSQKASQSTRAKRAALASSAPMAALPPIDAEFTVVEPAKAQKTAAEAAAKPEIIDAEFVDVKKPAPASATPQTLALPAPETKPAVTNDKAGQKAVYGPAKPLRLKGPGSI